MKNILLLICLLWSGLTYSQSKTIGKIAPMGAFVADLGYSVNGKDTIYTLTFNDKKYTKIDAFKVISFNDIGFFYNKLKESFKKDNNYTETFDLGKYSITIKKTKSMGVISVMILVDDAYTTLTEKQVDKLFGH